MITVIMTFLQCHFRLFYSLFDATDKPLISSSYTTSLKEFYSADPMSLDFGPLSKSASVAAVNEWVSKATNGNIEKMVDKDDVGEETRYF